MPEITPTRKADLHQSLDGRSRFYNYDAGRILDVLGPNSVDLIITSPPYFDLKHYGTRRAIGSHGTYEEYLTKLRRVFGDCLKVAKQTASMYLVVDVFKKNGRMKLLPLDLARDCEELGWRLRDIVVWDKTRTLPWSHKGELRNTFEFILLFTKSNRYKFRIDRLRQPFDNLKPWWVKYPERYNPRGAVPRGIWVAPIPTQGSWGNGNFKHGCPFPPELVSKMVSLSSDPRDVVLDPFAGSGSVLAQAEAMGRHAFGFEINRKYIYNYHRNLRRQILVDARKRKVNSSSSNFEELVWKLRQLKFAAVLGTRLQLQLRRKAVKYMWLAGTVPKIGAVRVPLRLHVQLAKDEYRPKAESIVAKLVERPPLSKFGLDADVVLTTSPPRRGSTYEWLYPEAVFYRPPVSLRELQSPLKNPRGLKVHTLSNLYVDSDSRSTDLSG